MTTRRRTMLLAGLAGMLLLAAAWAAPQRYETDLAHSAISFKIQHLGIAWVHGRFNEFSGEIHHDPANPVASSVTVTARTASVDTGIERRDDHLRNADFFDAEKHPEIVFRSTKVAVGEGGHLHVTGDLTLHGVTKPVSFVVYHGGHAEFPEGTHRSGWQAHLTIKRSDFQMTHMLGPIGDEVHLEIALQGIRK